MIIQKISIDKINPVKYNPRKDLQPDDPEYQKLKKSIAEFDLVEPLIWNKRTGNLVGGHQRLKILIDNGITEVDVSIVDLDEAKEKALNIALNKISGEWDLPKLKDLLQEIDTGEFDIEITGFNEDEIEKLMTQIYQDDIQEDDFDLEKEVKKIEVCRAKKGDIFQLGEHKIMCGDSTCQSDVEKLMGGGGLADLIFTDPPYNVGYVELNHKMRDSAKDWTYCNDWKDKMSRDKFKEFLSTAISNALIYSRKNLPIYIWFAFTFYDLLCEIFKELNIPYDKVPIIWKKQTMPISWARYKRNYEPCFYAGVGAAHTGKNSRWYGPNNEVAVWEINADFNGSYIHPTQKPIALAAKAIKNSSAIKNIVLDLFGGSGSTLMACEQLNRINRTMEYEPKYCEAILNRWEKFTDKKAVLCKQDENQNQ